MPSSYAQMITAAVLWAYTFEIIGRTLKPEQWGEAGMEISVEEKLRKLLQAPGPGPDSARDALLRDVLLLQLALQVGASVRGIYDDKTILREEELARRIREANRATWEISPRLRSHKGIRNGLILAGLILGLLAAIAAIAALAVKLSLLAGP